MRNRICLAAAMLCALATEPVVGQVRSGSVLERKVTVTFNEAPLESVLRTLRRQYGVRISYSNTALDLKQPVTVSANNQPLRTVLGEVLRDKNIGYELVGDQVVLHPSAPKAATKPAPAAAPTATTTTVNKAVIDRAPDEAPRSEPSKAADKPSAAPAAKPGTPAKAAPTKKEPAKATKSQSATSKASNTGGGKAPTKAAVPSKSATPAQAATVAKPNGQGAAATGAGGTNPEIAPVATATISAPAATTPAAATPPITTEAKPIAKQDSTAVAAAPPAATESEEPARPTYKEPAQISFLGPLGSNGLRSGQTVNNLSINVLGGYAAGVEGFEAAGLFNIDRDTVDGAQVAGLANIVGKHLDGVQGAGLMNVLGGGGRGWQAAGLLNVAARPIAGAQTAGLFNYVGPTKKLPVVADAAPAAEAVPTRKPTVQAAGLFNVALGEVRGGQAAGLLNVAGTVHGVQLAGLLNVADSVDGVSIAPINFVRHGYHRFEVTNSEVWPVSASLKLGGSAAFYTFFTGAYAGFGNKPRRWALGYGLGSEVWARRRLSLALDAVAMHVNEEQRGWTRDLNLDSQLRLLLGVAPFKKDGHLRIVFGPTVSVLVTQRYDTTEQQVYSNLAEGRKLWLDEGNSATRVLGWVGYTAGIRF
ncbi:FecR domain-containing protein [Hymenobacter latericus]|uniref:FecR domain-containing protein n=1 Tax=Hymenobacter sp. YIM 151858-1 TaxID=2987688 RepID=UPI0022266FE4|nr:FecR domain-containing protein [Hymenobacter sp. YIM 151858-1]UYZ58778.1 hypothetical protein OIS50_17170 [Hymenobacter sp. YIM 151858-1]